MSQTSLMLKPTMEGWQDRELDAKTSYLMDNVKYTSRGALLQLSCLEQFYTFLILGLGVFWLIFLPALGIYYTIRTRQTVRATSQDDKIVKFQLNSPIGTMLYLMIYLPIGEKAGIEERGEDAFNTDIWGKQST